VIENANELERRLREARPRVATAPPPFAVVLARIQAPDLASVHARRPRRSRRIGMFAALAALAVAACAWGATQLLSGSMVVTGFLPASPNTGVGAPLASSAALLGLRTDDPGGGPPWGMRIVRTTRGQACVQVGRVLDGNVGAIGSGYAFGDDGRFHPFSPEDALGLRCIQPDVNGHVFDVQGPMTVSENALSLAESMVDRVHCDLPGEHDWGLRCPLSQLRVLAFGTLGPDARTMTVSYRGRSSTVVPYGPEGAYLLVFKAPKGTNVGYFGAQAPHPPVLTVHFADGSSCQLPPAGDIDLCRPQGIEFPHGPALGTAQVAAAVHARYGLHVAGGVATMTATSASSSSVGFQRKHAGPAIVVTFTARAAVSGPLTTYGVELRRPVVKGCFGGPVLDTQQPSPTLAAGSRVKIVVQLQAICHGPYRGRVYFLSLPESDEANGEERIITEMTGNLIALMHRPRPGVTVGEFELHVPVNHNIDPATEPSPPVGISTARSSGPPPAVKRLARERRERREGRRRRERKR
jgi:hypothetical protein